MAIIKCQNCGNDVSDKARQCPHCQATINDTNGIETVLNKARIRTEKSNTIKNKRIYNRVATKFNFVVWIVKFIGYAGGTITWIVLANLENGLAGFVICIITCIATWISTLLFEAVAEGLQLLQDIKDKI